jgi:hypothetical protein
MLEPRVEAQQRRETKHPRCHRRHRFGLVANLAEAMRDLIPTSRVRLRFYRRVRATTIGHRQQPSRICHQASASRCHPSVVTSGDHHVRRKTHLQPSKNAWCERRNPAEVTSGTLPRRCYRRSVRVSSWSWTLTTSANVAAGSISKSPTRQRYRRAHARGHCWDPGRDRTLRMPSDSHHAKSFVSPASDCAQIHGCCRW